MRTLKNIIHLALRPVRSTGRFIVFACGKLLAPVRRSLRYVGGRYMRLAERHPIMQRLWFRAVSLMLAVIILVTPLTVIINNYITSRRYDLSASASALAGKTTIDAKLIKETDTAFTYNRADEASPKIPEQVLIAAGQKTDATGKKPYQAELSKDPSKGITFSDSTGDRSFTLKPQFGALPAKMTDDRIMYPSGSNEKHIYSFKTNGIKSDIILTQAPSQTTKSYQWDLNLSSNLEARMLPNGGVGIYSADNNLFGVQTDNQADQALLDNARSNGQKNTLAFELPKPFILDQSSQENYQDAGYSLRDGILTLTVTNLDKHSYPLTIDPTITVDTTGDFAQRTGDTGNIDSNTSGQITRASSTTGAVGETTQQTSAFTTARQGQTSVVYNGYLYIIGGRNTSNTAQNDIQYCPLNSNGSVGTCTQQTNAFTTARYNHTSVVYNGYLYIIGGVAGVYQNDIQYCPLNSNGSVGTCTQQTSAFTNARNQLASAVYNGYLYIVGGVGASSYSDIQYCALNSNGSVGTCNVNATGFTTARYGLSAVVYNGYLYVIGGYSGVYQNDIQYCPLNSNGSVGSCTQQTSAFTTARAGHSSVVYNGYLYVIGGSDGTFRNDIQYCPLNSNGSVGTCTQQTSAFTTARTQQSSVVAGGYLYIIGGGDGTVQNDIQYLLMGSPISPATQQAAAFTTARFNHASVVYNGYLYITGGSNGSFQSDIQYCPLNGNGIVGTCITNATGMTTGRALHTSVAYNGYLYIIGGNSGTITNDIEYCPFNSDGSVGSCTQQLGAFITARVSHASVVYNGYLYIIGGASAGPRMNDIQYCALNNSDGSVGSCTQQANAFTGAREGLAAAVSNGYLYITGGYTGTAQNDIQYCPINSNGSTGTCTQQTNAFTTARLGHASVVSNGYLYIIGGWNLTTNYNDISYCPINSDGSVGTCTQKTAAFSVARRNLTSVVYNGYIYIIGGYSGSYQNDIQRMQVGSSNGGQGSTTQQTSAFTVGRSGHSSVVYNGYLYIIGGLHATSDTACNSVASTYCSDIVYCPLNSNGSVGTCTQQTNAFTTARQRHTSVAYNGYLYIIGGTNGTKQNDIQYCPLNSNGSVGTCTQQTSAFTLARSGFASVTYNGYLYIIGGDVGFYDDDIQYCPLNSNGSVGTCTQQISAFTNGRTLHSSVVYNGYLYIIGGLSFGYENDIQYCPLNSNGSVGTCTRQMGAFTTPRFSFASVVYNGYLYIIGGNSGGSYEGDIQYCPLETFGSVGTCTRQDSAYTTARGEHTSVAYNGQMYIIGGNGGSYMNDIQYLPFKTISDTARYERFFDTGSAANNITSLTLQGSTACKYTLLYKTAGSNGVWGAATTIRYVSPGVAQSIAVNSQRYVYAAVTLDDTTCGAQSTITSIALQYNAAPDAPVLISPGAAAVNVAVLPELRVGTTEGDSDYVQYRIDICTTSNCSAVLRTIDQTSSQTGWLSQSLQSGTAYVGDVTLTQIAIHKYQPTALTANTQYWWRAQAIDPGGTNNWSAYSAIGSFTTAAVTQTPINVGGGTINIYGNTKFRTGP